MPDRSIISRLAPISLTVVLLLGVAGLTLARPSARDAQPYLQHVAQVVSQQPLNFDDWTGHDEQLPTAAIELLRPNAVLSRKYSQEDTGDAATFLLVQCGDVRDLAGHYPRICYPNNGYTLESAEPATWTVRGQTIPGTNYRFTIGSPGNEKTVDVANFLMLPRGELVPDMETVELATEDFAWRVFGAGQVQVVTAGTMDPQRREEVVRLMIDAHWPIVEAITYSAGSSDAP